jgi:hypothetical protein
MTPRHGISDAASRGLASGAVTKKRYAEKPAILTLKMDPERLKRIDDEVIYQINAKGRILTRAACDHLAAAVARLSFTPPPVAGVPDLGEERRKRAEATADVPATYGRQHQG